MRPRHPAAPQRHAPATIKPDGTFSRTETYTIRYNGPDERYRVTFSGRFLADGAVGTLRGEDGVAPARQALLPVPERHTDLGRGLSMRDMLAREEVAAWLGLSAAGPAAPRRAGRRGASRPRASRPRSTTSCSVARRADRPLPGHQRRVRAFRPSIRGRRPQLADHPVVNVTRAEAPRSARGSAGGCRRGAEWEAARRPDDLAVGRHVRPRALQLRRGRLGLDDARARAFDAGPGGAQDLAGNVWEWVGGRGRGVKGGCYLDTAYGLVSARSLPADPERATAPPASESSSTQGGDGWTASSC